MHSLLPIAGGSAVIRSLFENLDAARHDHNRDEEKRNQTQGWADEPERGTDEDQACNHEGGDETKGTQPSVHIGCKLARLAQRVKGFYLFPARPCEHQILRRREGAEWGAPAVVGPGRQYESGRSRLIFSAWHGTPRTARGCR